MVEEVEVKMIKTKCKDCGDIDIFENEEEAKEEGWHNIGKHWICDDCYEGDDDEDEDEDDDNDDDDDDDDSFSLSGLGGSGGSSFGGALFGGASFGGGGGKG